MASNWFEQNIGNGRFLTPWDINKYPRQYRMWSGKKDFYPASTNMPNIPKKETVELGYKEDLERQVIELDKALSKANSTLENIIWHKLQLEEEVDHLTDLILDAESELDRLKE